MSPDNRLPDRVFVLSSDGSAGWAKAMMTEIDAALRFIGVPSVLLRPADAGEVLAGHAPEHCFLIDANHKVATPVPWRKFSVMVDHPCTRIADLEQGYPAVETLGWVDASHIAAATTLGLPYRSVFLPHAGPDPIAAPMPMRERDIDLFFAGTLAEPMDRARWFAENRGTAERLGHIIFDAIDELERGPEPVIPAFLRVCAHHGVKAENAFSRQDFCAIVTRIHDIAEMNRRHDLLAALPELKIAVASAYLPKALAGRRGITHLGHIEDFAAIRRLMARAKVVLNSTGKFPQGAHERIWFGMAEGAVILTDRSGFMEADFAPEIDILYLPTGRPAPAQLEALKGLVQNPARLDVMAHRARGIYARQHTWKQRVWTIREVMERG